MQNERALDFVHAVLNHARALGERPIVRRFVRVVVVVGIVQSQVLGAERHCGGVHAVLNDVGRAVMLVLFRLSVKFVLGGIGLVRNFGEVNGASFVVF